MLITFRLTQARSARLNKSMLAACDNTNAVGVWYTQKQYTIRYDQRLSLVGRQNAPATAVGQVLRRTPQLTIALPSRSIVPCKP